MQTMQLTGVNHLRSLSSLGVQSSGLFGDVKTANFVYLPPKEYSRTGGLAGNIRATFSRTGPGSNPAPFPSRGNNQPSEFSQQNTPPPSSSEENPSDDGATAFPRPSAEAPNAPEDRNFTSAKPPSLSSDFKPSTMTNPIPGLPGQPRPKPGTPRPYDPTKQKSKVMEWLTPPPPPTELLQREHYKLSPTCTCTIYFGDLSKWNVDGKTDAVIAPANKRLNTGPAVNAVLFKAAGTRLLDATQRLPDVAPQGIKAEVGDAISTRAFNLPVSRVIHAVSPVYKKDDSGTRISDPDLIKAYKRALDVARKENLTHLAFPPLSCRIYGYPYSDGAEVALKTLKENSEGFSQIDIVIRNIEGYEAFIDEANRVLEPIREKKTIRLKMGSDSTVTEAAAAVIPPEVAPPQSPPSYTTSSNPPSYTSTSSNPPSYSTPSPTSPPSYTNPNASPSPTSSNPPSYPNRPTSSIPPSYASPPTSSAAQTTDTISTYSQASQPSQDSATNLQPSVPISSPAPTFIPPSSPNPSFPPPSPPFPKEASPVYGSSSAKPSIPPPLSGPASYGSTSSVPQTFPQYRHPPPQQTWQNAPPPPPQQSWQNAPQYQQNQQGYPQYQNQQYQNAPPPQYQQSSPRYQSPPPPPPPPPPPQYQQPSQNPPPPPPQYQQPSPQYQNAPPQYPPQYQNAPPQNPQQYQNVPPQNPPQYQNAPQPSSPQYQGYSPQGYQAPNTPPQQQEYNNTQQQQQEYQNTVQNTVQNTESSSSFVPPRERASPIPPSGPPPTPPSSPTMPFPKRYEYQ